MKRYTFYLTWENKTAFTYLETFEKMEGCWKSDFECKMVDALHSRKSKIKSTTIIFYKHMNFLAEAFAKHILCLFFSTKALVCYVLNFFEKKAFMCLFSQANYIEQSLFWPNCACDVLIFFDKSLHVLCA